MNDISPISRHVLKNIKPYEPGKPISEVQREYNLEDVVKLASNENPLGPSPMAVAAIKDALKDLNRYPDGGCYFLKSKLSGKLDFPMKQIVMGNGSAELVELITEAFIGQGDEAVIGKEAFFKYRIAVQIMNGVIAWAEMPDHTYDPDELLGKITDKTKVVFIANPNNPTGTLMKRDEVTSFMDRVPENVVVVFDEAYYDYRDPERYPDHAGYIRDGRNVIVLRTLSKSYGLAGLRIGYALTTEPIAYAMNAVREAFNVNSLAQAAAIAALDDDEFLEKGIKLNEEGKRYYYSELKRLGLDYLPTDANFVLVKTPVPGRELFGILLQKGVIIRPVDGYGLPDCIRVSIGLPEENKRFIVAMEEVLKDRGFLTK